MTNFQPVSGVERRRRILAHARDQGRVVVSELACSLDVAVETVRRDLQVLEDDGLLRRTHGGAYPIEHHRFEPPLKFRMEHDSAEKQRIAAAAVDLMGAAASLFIDEGSTALAVAAALAAHRQPITVVTPSMAVATTLAERSNAEVLMLGGLLRAGSLATVGAWATSMLAEFCLELAIVGASGISMEKGLTTTDPAVSDLKRTVMGIARRKVFVGTHTKFGLSSFSRFADVKDLDVLVTGSGLTSHTAGRYQASGVRVVRA